MYLWFSKNIMAVLNNRRNKWTWLVGLKSLHCLTIDNDETSREYLIFSKSGLVKIAAVTWQQKFVLAVFKYLLQLTFSTAVQLPNLQPQLIRPSPSPLLLCCPLLKLASAWLIQSPRPQHSQPPNVGCYQASVLEQSLGGGVGEMFL